MQVIGKGHMISNKKYMIRLQTYNISNVNNYIVFIMLNYNTYTYKTIYRLDHMRSFNYQQHDMKIQNMSNFVRQLSLELYHSCLF